MVMRMIMCITGAVFVSKSEIYLGASGRGGGVEWACRVFWQTCAYVG